jgi:uncharacterized protein (DUF302 family)
MEYGISKKIDIGYDDAVIKVTEELKKEGFGVLTTIDVRDTLKKKLNVDFQKYIILGACNPPFAYESLQSEIEIGLLLPCNFIIYESNSKETFVSAFDPMVMSNIIQNEKLEEVSRKVREKISIVMNSI